MTDVVFLVADKNMEYVLRGLLETESPHLRIGCGPFTSTIIVATGQNDPGLYTRAGEFLRGLRALHSHVVVMMDVQWQGSPGAERIRKRLREHILAAGWPEQDALGLAIDPEIDAWLWTGTDHTSRALGWSTMEALGSSLQQAGYLQQGSSKPACPKEAAEWALRQVRKPRSSTVYAAVSCRASLDRCSDPALRLLVDTLRRWFPDAAAGVETC